MSNDFDDLIAMSERVLRANGINRCQHEMAEFRGDTGEGRIIRCTNEVTWLDSEGRQWCSEHPTPEIADQGKILIAEIERTKQWIKHLSGTLEA